MNSKEPAAAPPEVKPQWWPTGTIAKSGDTALRVRYRITDLNHQNGCAANSQTDISQAYRLPSYAKSDIRYWWNAEPPGIGICGNAVAPAPELTVTWKDGSKHIIWQPSNGPNRSEFTVLGIDLVPWFPNQPSSPAPSWYPERIVTPDKRLEPATAPQPEPVAEPLAAPKKPPTIVGAQVVTVTPDASAQVNKAQLPVKPPLPADQNVTPLIKPIPADATGTAPDGNLLPQPQPEQTGVKPGTHVVGTVAVPANGPRPELRSIAAELGRIEQKTARLIRDNQGGTGPDLATIAGLVQQVLQALFAVGDQGAYIIAGPCERDEQGNPIPIESTIQTFPWGGSPLALVNIAQRLDALAQVVLMSKFLRQPTCKGPTPAGDFVSVQFREIDPPT